MTKTTLTIYREDGLYLGERTFIDGSSEKFAWMDAQLKMGRKIYVRSKSPVYSESDRAARQTERRQMGIDY